MTVTIFFHPAESAVVRLSLAIFRCLFTVLIRHDLAGNRCRTSSLQTRSISSLIRSDALSRGLITACSLMRITIFRASTLAGHGTWVCTCNPHLSTFTTPSLTRLSVTQVALQTFLRSHRQYRRIMFLLHFRKWYTNMLDTNKGRPLLDGIR